MRATRSSEGGGEGSATPPDSSAPGREASAEAGQRALSKDEPRRTRSSRRFGVCGLKENKTFVSFVSFVVHLFTHRFCHSRWCATAASTLDSNSQLSTLNSQLSTL